MNDIICRVCGEPWDMDELHDTPDGLEWGEAASLFRAKGCGAVFGNGECRPVDSQRTAMAGMLTDLLGDDMDGLASELSDAEYMGLL